MTLFLFAYVFCMIINVCQFVYFFFCSVALNGLILLTEDLMKKIALERFFLLMIVFLYQRHRRRCHLCSQAHARPCFKIDFNNNFIHFSIVKARKSRKNQFQLLPYVRQKHQKDRIKRKMEEGKFLSPLISFHTLVYHTISNL
jgi:hypothetical protein